MGSPGPLREYLTYTLSNVHISSYQASFDGDPLGPSDTLTLNFGAIQESHATQNKDGLGTPVVTSWDQQVTLGPVTVPNGTYGAYENVDQTISGISINASAGASQTITLAVGHGTLTLGTISGLTVTGNGSGSVTLLGTTANLNAALASLIYRGSHDYYGSDTLSLTATEGTASARASVGITVISAAQQAANLQVQVIALQTAGVLNAGRANTLITDLALQGNNGDMGKVQDFLDQVNSFLEAGILTQAQANALLGPGNILLLSVTRQ